jgi:hypothetical protein
MTDTDRPAFLKLMQRLGVTFNRQIDDAVLMVFWDALDDLKIEDLDDAARDWCREGDRFPVPANLREGVRDLKRRRFAIREQDDLNRRLGRGANTLARRPS